jgi:hypothetical protein
MSDLESLVTALTKAARIAAGNVVGWRPGSVARWANIEPSAVKLFADALHQCPIVEKNDHKMITSDRFWFRFDIDVNAIYYVDRAIDFDPRLICKDIIRFFTEQKTTIVDIHTFGGAIPADDIDVGDGLRVVPARLLPDIEAVRWIMAVGDSPTGAIVKRDVIGFTFENPPPPGEVPLKGMNVEHPDLQNKRNRILSSMALVSGAAVRQAANLSTAIDLGYPFMIGGGFGGSASTGLGYAAPLDKKKFLHILKALEKHPKAEKIDLAFSKLMSASLKGDPDRVVDLGTCIEILLMDEGGGNGEIKNKVSTRAAWLLGKDFEARKIKFSIAADLYDCRSKAVHTGKMMVSKLKGDGPFYAQQAHYNLCRDLIEAIILRPSWPNWNDLVLGCE